MIAKPYLIFMGDERSQAAAKTGYGVRDWARADVVGQWRLPECAVDLNLPDLAPPEAFAQGARSLLIGVAPVGGVLPERWTNALVAAMEAGLDLVSGLHSRLSASAPIRTAAQRLGRSLHDVRHADRTFPVASGAKRPGKRLLTVGTDCALGKKYTALAISKAMQARGYDATFRATGQTGIMISGAGVAIDAVVADFIAGAAEELSPAAAPDHWDIIEGQGALHHPAYAGVTLGLLHGSQPDALILCHDPARRTLNAYPTYEPPTFERAMAGYEDMARLTNPKARFVAISLNTSSLREEDAKQLAEDISKRFALPCFDPMRFGVEAAVDGIIAI